MKKTSKIWYSFLQGVSEDDHIGFYENNNFPWTSCLEKHTEIISNEIERYLKENETRIKPYFNNALVTQKKRWKISTFFIWTWLEPSNMKKCPETMKLLYKIPGIISASISILEANVAIKAHRGDTNAIIRCHLPLKVPGQLPECGFKVKYDERSWEVGKLLLFNDSARHEAWNFTNERRYVLLFDVMRPEFKNKKYRVSATVLAGLVMQALMEKIPFLKKAPILLLEFFIYPISILLNPILRLQSYRNKRYISAQTNFQ